MKVVRTATMLFIDVRCRHKKSVSVDRAGKSPIRRLITGMKCTGVMIPGFLLSHAVSVAMLLALGVRCCAVVSSCIMRVIKPQHGL